MVEQGDQSSAMAYGFAHALTVLWILVNIFVLLPFITFLTYTLAQILPTLAAVSDPDTSTAYNQISLSDLEADEPSNHAKSLQPSLFRPDLTLGSMLSQLLSHRTSFKYLAFFRGMGIMVFISVVEVLVVEFSAMTVGTPSFRSTLAFVNQILVALALVQLYTLWTHTVLTHPSTKSFWQSIPPFKAALRATGVAIVILLTAKASIRYILASVFGIDLMDTNINPYQPIRQGVRYAVGSCVTDLILMPANVILVRIQASLLPADEQSVVPLDEALHGENGESEAIGLKKAWSTFGWGAWRNLIVLYGQVSALLLLCGGGLLVADFMALQYLIRLRNGTL